MITPSHWNPYLFLPQIHGSFFVRIDNQDGEGLLSIPCRAAGRKWADVVLFLTAVCGQFDISEYSLMKGYSTMDDLTDSSIIPPGYYKLKAVDTQPPLCIKYTPLRIVPSGGLSRNASGFTTPIEEDSTFKERIIQRDQHFVITRRYNCLNSSHIVAHACWADNPYRKAKLPEDIRLHIESLDGKINHISNVILLDVGLAGSFDQGDLCERKVFCGLN